MSHCFPFYFHFHFASEPVSSAVVSPMDFRGRHRQRSRWRRPSDAAQQTIHFFRGFRFGISTSLRFFFFYISFFYFFFWVVTPLRVPPFLIFFTFIFSFFCMCVCACVAVVAAAARLPSDVALSFTRLFQEDPSASLAVEARQTASEPDADFVIWRLVRWYIDTSSSAAAAAAQQQQQQQQQKQQKQQIKKKKNKRAA